MKQSQRWIQLCPRRESNSGSSDLWYNTPYQLDHWGNKDNNYVLVVLLIHTLTQYDSTSI